MMKIIRWQPYMNHHQYSFWAEVENILGKKILFVLNSTISDIRKSQGWKPYNLDNISHIFLENLMKGLRIIRDNPGAIHIFHSFFGPNRRYLLYIIIALLRREKVVVTAEPYSEYPAGYFYEEKEVISKIKCVLRPCLYQLLSKVILNLFRPSQFCILAISNMAVRQFLSNGFPHYMVFPFGYFIPSNYSGFSQHNVSGGTSFIFLGSAKKIKGIDLIISSVKLLSNGNGGKNFFVHLYGAGDIRRFLSEEEDIPVLYKGLISPENVQEVISKYDVLILPSYHDGWGVVVNEALLQDVPVIVSNTAGASDLVRLSGAGLIFESGSVEDLTRALGAVLHNQRVLGELKVNAKKFDKDIILPHAGAHYFVDVISAYFLNSPNEPPLLWSKDL